MFFRADAYFDRTLVHAFLRRLCAIESWFDSQSSYGFIASSLLFVYDGAAVRQPPSHVASTNNGSSADCVVNNGCQTTHGAGSGITSESGWDDNVQLKMIDFTHAFSVSSRDDNYLTGLRSIISYMSCLKPGMYEPDPWLRAVAECYVFVVWSCYIGRCFVATTHSCHVFGNPREFLGGLGKVRRRPHKIWGRVAKNGEIFDSLGNICLCLCFMNYATVFLELLKWNVATWVIFITLPFHDQLDVLFLSAKLVSFQRKKAPLLAMLKTNFFGILYSSISSDAAENETKFRSTFCALFERFLRSRFDLSWVLFSWPVIRPSCGMRHFL